VSVLRAGAIAMAAAVLAAFAVGCTHGPPPKVAKLRVIAEPETTRVTVDDQYAGRARVLAKQPRALTPGKKLITFEADDYFPHDVEVNLPQGETTIRIKLRPIPP
jgi:hypothetical protein